MDPLLLQGTVKFDHYFFVDTCRCFSQSGGQSIKIGFDQMIFLPIDNRSRGKTIN